MESIDSSRFIGRDEFVVIERPTGSRHPRHGFEYPVVLCDARQWWGVALLVRLFASNYGLRAVG